jgi:hypothetical protein
MAGWVMVTAFQLWLVYGSPPRQVRVASVSSHNLHNCKHCRRVIRQKSDQMVKKSALGRGGGAMDV